MHRHPEALAHLQAIRASVSRAADPEVRKVAMELIDRLEAHFHLRRLSKTAVLAALGAFRGIHGTEESIQALHVIASTPDDE